MFLPKLSGASTCGYDGGNIGLLSAILSALGSARKPAAQKAPCRNAEDRRLTSCKSGFDGEGAKISGRAPGLIDAILAGTGETIFWNKSKLKQSGRISQPSSGVERDDFIKRHPVVVSVLASISDS